MKAFVGISILLVIGFAVLLSCSEASQAARDGTYREARELSDAEATNGEAREGKFFGWGRRGYGYRYGGYPYRYGYPYGYYGGYYW